MPRWGGQDYSGITAEFAGTGNASARLYTYQVGWRLGTEWRHFDLYTSLMVGGARVVTWGLSNAGVPVSLVRNSFASSITTTGLDLLLGQHYAVKLIEIDFPIVMVPYPSTGHGSWIGDDRASAGIAYRFGRRQP